VPQPLTAVAVLAGNQAPSTAAGTKPAGIPKQHSRVHYRFADVQNHKVFYREAGPKDAPVILLLHGFPTSSHMFRNLIPLLADRYRVVAPDLPGFGFTVSPCPFEHTFEHLAEVIDGFMTMIGGSR
jgi:pimeloyl-ACP methyl ester carboxylesterase